MAESYDTVWPVSYADQKHHADFLLARAKILYARKTPITLNRFIEPTQAEWENAYVLETGLPLPIPVGTKLIWRSMRSGRVLTYGTLNDSNSGSSSTGIVYNMLNMEYNRPSFRLLGVADTARQESLASNSRRSLIPILSWYPSGTFIFGLNLGQIYYWMEQGLDSLLFMYKIRANEATARNITAFFGEGAKEQVSQLWGFDGGTDQMEGLTEALYGDKTTPAGFGSATSQAADYNIDLTPTVTNAVVAPANVWSYGHIWLHNCAQNLNLNVSPNVPRENYQNPQGYTYGSYIGASISEANTAINWGMWVKENQGFSRSEYMTVGLPSASAAYSGKLWAYGLFKKITGNFGG